MCEICGQYYHRVTTHVRQAHDMDAYTYKKLSGFDTSKSLISEWSKKKSQRAVAENPKVLENLKLGAKTRFKVGSSGRTKDMVSPQTRKRLRDRLKQEPMNSVLRESGRRLGKSGLGNLARWKTNTKEENKGDLE